MPSRGDALRVGLRFLLAASILGTGCARSRPDKGISAESVLLVTIDTLRADRVGAFGGSAGATPNMDALAARGIVFETALTTAPLTLPAHASVMTGLWPFRHGARVNGTDSVAPDVPLLAERFARAGFATGAVVGSLVLRAESGLARGFESYDDRFAENRGRPQREWNARRPGDEVVDRAIGWIDRAGSRRFFLWVHLYDPHAPYEPPAAYRERFPGRPYEGAVASADAALGRLVSHLESRGLLARTLVAVAGDHGESLGEHGETTHGVFLYDATLRVPLVLVAPGPSPARRVREPVSLADLAPTLAAAAGVPPSPADGVSLWPLARGLSAAPHRVYAESVYPAALLGWSPLRCVRSSRGKYVEAPRPEFYDLVRDPGESRNVFSTAEGDARGLARQLAAIRRSGGSTRVAAAGGAESVARLASLGYLTPSGKDADLDRIGPGGTDPKDTIGLWDRIERAIIARQSGHPAEGAALLESVVAADRAASPVILRELASSLKRSGRIERAIQVYERILRETSPVAEDFFALGVCWHMRGRDDLAAHAHELAVTADPRDIDAWVDLGQERLALGRLPAARDAFVSAVRLDPSSVDALSGLAAVAFAAKDYRQAAGNLRRALALSPERTETIENLARVERALGNAAEARRLEARLSSLRSRGDAASPLRPPVSTLERDRRTQGSKGGFDAEHTG